MGWFGTGFNTATELALRNWQLQEDEELKGKKTATYVVKYRYPRKYGGKIQTAKFKTGIRGFRAWLKERSPTIVIIKHGYAKER